MGLWIELTSNNTSLIRDIATGEESGYEFDRSALYTKANWWLWGQFGPLFEVDAEVGLWAIDHAFYQANSYGANIPDVTVADGLQGFAGMFFSPIYGLNSRNPGFFNKMGFTVATPYLKTRFGYGELNAATMRSFTGIYNVIDPWNDVGRGFTEVSLGDSLKNIGDDVEIDALFALSRMRAEYGVYSLVQASLFEKTDIAVTYTSTTNSPELFRYNEQNDNAISLYAAYKPAEALSVGVHGLASFGTGIEPALTATAAALRADVQAGPYHGVLTQSLAGSAVVSVWGDDESVTPGASVSSLYQWFTVNELVRIGLDTDFTLNGIADAHSGLWNIRNQPLVDFNLGGLIDKEMDVSVYGVINIDRIAASDDAAQPWAARFEEAGLEFRAGSLHPSVKKLVFAYALSAEYQSWSFESGAYDLDALYHSFMVNWDITGALSATLGSVYRTKSAADSTLVPFGLAAGVSLVTNWKAVASPRIWMHITYAMDPYEDNNYTLYRYDDPDNKLVHRSYRLNHLSEDVNTSRVSFGLIWDL
jgi:hypothetical protein